MPTVKTLLLMFQNLKLLRIVQWRLVVILFFFLGGGCSAKFQDVSAVVKCLKCIIQKFKIKSFNNIICCTWTIIFIRGGSRTCRRRGRQPLGRWPNIFIHFLKNPMKLKKFWSVGGGAGSDPPPPHPPLLIYKQSIVADRDQKPNCECRSAKRPIFLQDPPFWLMAAQYTLFQLF